jgi:hypothetical protein
MAKPVDLDLQAFMRDSVMAGLSTRLRLAGEDLGSELAKEMLEDPEFRAEWKRVAAALAASLRQRLEGES